MKEIKFYPEAWFKVEYTGDSIAINFKAWEIEGLDEDNIEQSTICTDPVITGHIKWDGCCEFDYSTHWCGIYKGEQFLLLMKEIYKFQEGFDTFVSKYKIIEIKGK
jgi:hypothetical protein